MTFNFTLETASLTTGVLTALMVTSILAATTTDYVGEDIYPENKNTFFADSVLQQTFIDLPPLSSIPQSHAAEIQQLIPGLLTLGRDGSGAPGIFYYRGANLIHGTGISTKIDGIPLNITSHVVGQGYTDTNLLTREFIQGYKIASGSNSVSFDGKASAGNIHYSSVSSFDDSTLQMSLGAGQYFRMLAATSDKHASGDFMYAVDTESYEGPWDNIKEDEENIASFINRTWKRGAANYKLSIIAYRNNWNNPGLVPARAINAGSISSLGVVDTSDLGQTRFVAMSVGRTSRADGVEEKSNVFISAYEYRLFSNKTWFLIKETEGDQTEQLDKRVSWGASYRRTSDSTLFGYTARYTLGADVQHDTVGESASYNTDGRNRLSTISADKFDQTSAGLFVDNAVPLNKKTSANINARFDIVDYDVKVNNLQSNDLTDNIAILGAGLNYSFSPTSTAFLEYSQHYSLMHARDITDNSDPFSRVNSSEAGARFNFNNLVATAVVWHKSSNKEPVFIPEDNIIADKRASKRSGIDINVNYQWLKNYKAQVALSKGSSRYVSATAGTGNSIPGAPDIILVSSLSYNKPGSWFGTLYYKYLGERPLNEASTESSESVGIIDFRAGYRNPDFSIYLDILNLLDSDSRETEYYYKSRLEGEMSGGIEGTHYRVTEPRTYRLYLTHEFK